MSSVFLSFGPESGFITGHCLNSLMECLEMKPTWYSETQVGLLPNAVFFENAKTVHLVSEMEDSQEKIEKSTGQKVSKISQADNPILKVPKYKPTPFIEYVKSGGQTILPLNKPRPNFHLEASEICWSDIVNFNLSRKSFVEIPGTDVEPLQTYQEGFEIASSADTMELFTDPIRRTMETCDRVGSFISFVDRNKGFGGIFSKTAEFLMEEAPKAVRFTYSSAQPATDNETACNISLTLASTLASSHLHSVLLPPSELPTIFDPSRIISNNLYQSTAMLSIPVLASLLPLLHGVVNARNYLDTIAPMTILKFSTLEACFPYFDDMHLFGFPATGRIYSRFTATSGIGADVRNQFIGKLRPIDPYFYFGCGQDSPDFIGFTMPHFFKDGVITADGQKPTIKPAGMPNADFEKLVKFGVIKMKEGVNCEAIRFLSAVTTYSTAKSLAEPLRTTVDYIKAAPSITRTISSDDAAAMLDPVMDIIDGLSSSD